MTIITPPAVLPVRKDKIRRIAPSRVSRSAWSGSRQVELLPHARWGFSPELAPREFTAANAKAWRAFFTSLNGQANQFKLYPEPVAQTSNNNGLVAGASQIGYSLNIDGLTNPAGTGLTVGDWATITLPNKGDQLVMLTAISEGGDGTATITFWPAMREAPADNALVNLQNPYAVVSLTEDVFDFERDLSLFHYFAFDVEESW